MGDGRRFHWRVYGTNNGQRYEVYSINLKQWADCATPEEANVICDALEAIYASTPNDQGEAQPCSALAGTFDIEAIEQAFFNHDHDGSEPAPGQWEKRRDQWRSFKAYLAAHPRQKTSGRDAYKDEMPNAKVQGTAD